MLSDRDIYCLIHRSQLKFSSQSYFWIGHFEKKIRDRIKASKLLTIGYALDLEMFQT